MKVSLKWLSEFVDISDYFEKPEVLAEALTRGGLEVEEVRIGQKIYHNVVIGLILNKEVHPSSEKLSICQVTTGDGVLHRIVCGAQNHKANDRVVVALPGAQLPNGMKIVTAAVRGVESGGMLCSDDELGLSSVRAEGIKILPESAVIGQSFAKWAGLDDITMELKVTPNRADCLSHWGLAREISCLLEKPLKEFSIAFEVLADAPENEVHVEVESSILCPRYCGRSVYGVNIGPSPNWLVQRLESVGLRSINNVVDVTNFVMMELGQPLHAFDSSRVQGKKITVGPSKTGEVFEALDGKKHNLTGEELVIRDNQGPLALAGVIGGIHSGVTESTKNIFLESAYFEPSHVRRSGRVMGIQTDSSYRFSRGVNPQMTQVALDRAIHLILQIAGGRVSAKGIDVSEVIRPRSPIGLSIRTVTDRLGYPADAKSFESFFRRVGCEVKASDNGEYLVTPPLFRQDIEVDMDLVEEYARLNGYEKIPESIPVFKVEPTKHDSMYVASSEVGVRARSLGFSETVQSVFVSDRDERKFLGERSRLEELGLDLGGESISLLNPLSEDQNRVRSTLAFGLWQAVIRNFSQGNTSGRIYETGALARKTERGIQEQHRVAFAAWGAEEDLWIKEKRPLIFEITSVITNLCYGRVEIKSLPAIKALSFLHTGQQGEILWNGKSIGFLGGLHPSLLADHKIRVPVCLAELRLDAWSEMKSQALSYKPFSRFPRIDRDISVVVESRVAAGDMVQAIRSLKESHLVGCSVFDHYQGDKLPEHSKALGIRIQFQGRDTTLRDEDVNASMDRVLSCLREKFSAELR